MEKVKKTKSKVNMLLIPGIIVVAVTTQVPFLLTIIYSTLKWNLVRPDLGAKFVGFRNFADVLSNKEFYSVVLNTIILTGLSLALCTLIGIVFSLLLNRQLPGVNIIRTLMLGPFFVMPTVTGIIWKTLILDGSFGWLGHISNIFNIQLPDLFSTFPLYMIMLLIVWQWAPFFVLVILAGFQGISSEIVDSSKVDGANWFQSLIHIKIPMIFNHIQVAVMLGLIFIVKEFALIYVTTAGGPGVRSNNLAYYVFKIVFYGSDVGRAAAVAVIYVIITLIVLNLLYRAVQKRMGEEGRA